MKSPLSLEFKVACEIYRCKKKEKLATFREIANVFNLFGYTDKKILETINTLFDWSLITCEYHNPIESEIYSINDQALPTFKTFYKRYWKKERKELLLR